MSSPESDLGSEPAAGEPPLFDKTELDVEPEPSHEEEDPEEESMPPDRSPEAIAEDLLQGADLSIVTPESQPSVFSYLMSYRAGRMNALDVDGAEKADILLTSLQKMDFSSQRQTTLDGREAQFSRRLSAANERLLHVEELYRTYHERLAKSNAARISTLQAKHDKEREAFDESWMTPAKRRLFSHASTAMRALRTQAVWLVKARRYDDHRLFQQAVDEREQHETEEQARAMLMEYETQLKALTERQAQEMNGLITAYDGRLVLLNKSQTRQLSAARQRIQNIENEQKIHKESISFASGLRRTRRRAGSAASLAGPRVIKLDIAEITTVKLPPLLGNMVKRPHCYSSAAVRRSVGVSGPGRL
jgi:hypothetical protein